MLQELIQLLETEDHTFTKAELCAALATTPEHLETLLDFLVRKGRLEVVPDLSSLDCNTRCADCPIFKRCLLSPQTYYRLKQ